VQKFPCFVFDPTKFASATIHVRDPRATISIFPSGRVVITGVSNIYTANLATLIVIGLLKPEFPTLNMQPVVIQNITCTVNLGFYFDLRQCALDYPNRCVYVPSVFPGMQVTCIYGSLRHITYHKGCIVIIGSNDYHKVVQSLAYWYPIYSKYRYDPKSTYGRALHVKEHQKRKHTSMPMTIEDVPPVDNIIDDEIACFYMIN
jgi:TATA-box binding protein (TBP) (component of TFIID and TFIIIB)